jgi:hypothetical protein
MAMTIVVAVMLGALPAAAVAGGGGACGASASGWERVTLVEWWENTVDLGFGGDVDAAIETLAPLFGVDPTEAAVREAIIAGVAGYDRNANGSICMKDLPTTGGIPAYIFNVHDDSVSRL